MFILHRMLTRVEYTDISERRDYDMAAIDASPTLTRISQHPAFRPSLSLLHDFDELLYRVSVWLKTYGFGC